jgi:formiminoglutamase
MKNRNLESLSPLIDETPKKNQKYDKLILNSSSDYGVMRNNGKNGSCYAPRAIINTLKKFNHHQSKSEKILSLEVASQASERLDFEDAQKEESEKIANLITSYPVSKVIHIGGGHDHIYPLLLAIEKLPQIKNIIILNIDAHCDTRIDDRHHSGTPFRDYDNDGSLPYHLVQFGIQEHSNSKTTMSPITRGSEEKIFIEQLKDNGHQFSTLPKDLFGNCPFLISKEHTAFVFSLDCDGIDGADMAAVSCVNPHGVPINFLRLLLENSLSENFGTFFFGIYEFNPLFDELTNRASKTIATLINQALRKK